MIKRTLSYTSKQDLVLAPRDSAWASLNPFPKPALDLLSGTYLFLHVIGNSHEKAFLPFFLKEIPSDSDG